MLIVARGNLCQHVNLVAAYKKMNENVKIRYVDGQSYITNYKEIKDKPEFEEIANDKILEWNRRSLKRKGKSGETLILPLVT